jgi:hypothetical protein
MNHTTNQTSININTTNAKPQTVNAIKKVMVYDLRGQGRAIEKMRGIQI